MMLSVSPGPRTRWWYYVSTDGSCIYTRIHTTPQRCSVAYWTSMRWFGKLGSCRPVRASHKGGPRCSKCRSALRDVTTFVVGSNVAKLDCL